VVYQWHSKMNIVDYLTEAHHSCIVDDVNAMAFEEDTKIIGGHDVVEEYLAYDIFPLSDNWSLKIERALALKVVVHHLSSSGHGGDIGDGG
jgi:hypothetical protein